MGAVRKLTGASQAGRAARGAAATQAAAGRENIEFQTAARERAQEFFDPLQGVAARGIEGASFLGDPQAQFDFLQSNPLFNLALENANQRTLQQASAGRRASFGDTLQQLSNNVLLESQPLIDRQRQDVGALLDIGTGVAGSQANIEIGQAGRIGETIEGIGNVTAAGQIARGQQQAQAVGTLIDIGGTAAATKLAFSDERLKTNKKVIGEYNGHVWWSWDWNALAGQLFGLFGSSEGVMAQAAMLINPAAVIMDKSGFYKVKYGEV